MISGRVGPTIRNVPTSRRGNIAFLFGRKDVAFAVRTLSGGMGAAAKWFPAAGHRHQSHFLNLKYQIVRPEQKIIRVIARI